MNTVEIFKILIIAHASLGGVALISGFIASMTIKGSKPHVNSGRVFYYSLGISILLSFIAAIMPGHENPFLLSVGIFSGYFIVIGKRAILYKNSNHNYDTDRYIHIIMITTCILMIFLPVLLSKSFNIVAGVFGIVGMIFALRNLITLANQKIVKQKWLKIHIGHMSGGYISAVTAFVVVNNFLPGIYSWFVPGIIGSLFIMYFLRKADRKMIKTL